MRKPTVLVLGHARHGKDTVGELLCERYGLKYETSSAFAGRQIMMAYFESLGRPYMSFDECYADRVNHRAAWYEQIKAYNSPDKSRLTREMLAAGNDMYVGMRDAAEYEASRPLFRFVLWVDATSRGMPEEGRDSFNINRHHSMLTIGNGSSLKHLVSEVDRVAGYMGLEQCN